MTDQQLAPVDPDDARLYEMLHRPPRFSQRHPAVYPLAVWAHRGRRRVRWARVTSRLGDRAQRRVIDRGTGDTVREECVRRNAAVVKYVPSGVPVRTLEPPDPRLGRGGPVG